MRGYFKRDEKGFTLIELLIVVGIIGILAAIAIVNLIPARGRARFARAAGDTKSIVTQSMVVTSDYNLTPVAGLGFPLDPTFLWTQPNDTAGNPLPVFMAVVSDPWAAGTACLTGGAGQACYQFTEQSGVGCGGLGPGCVIFAAWTVGGNGNPDWNGTAAPAAMNDDLGNSTVQGCVFGPSISLASPC